MLGYYLRLALGNLRRSPGLTVLMVLSIGFGVAAAMTSWAVFRGVSGNPIPWKSGRLFVPQVDMFGPGQAGGDGEPPDALDYADAMALMRAHRAPRQSAIYAVAPRVMPSRPSLHPLYTGGYAVYGGFFPMLDVPFRYGSGWGARADAQRATVVVLGSRLNRRLFGGADSVGRLVVLDDRPYRVVGVLDDWNPQPVFFDVPDTGGFTRSEPDLFVPFRSAIAAGMANAGATQCAHDPQQSGFVGLQHSTCAWISFLVELDGAAQARDYRQFLHAYALDQKTSGRFRWPPNVRLRDLMAFLHHERVVPPDTQVSLLVAIGLLLVGLLNTVGLLLTRFMRRSGEIGVRRALGASRRAVAVQFMAETAMVGVAGGLAGLAFTGIGVAGVDLVLPARLAGLARFDLPLLAATLALALLAALAAGLYPVLRVMRVQPAWQLKSD